MIVPAFPSLRPEERRRPGFPSAHGSRRRQGSCGGQAGRPQTVPGLSPCLYVCSGDRQSLIWRGFRGFMTGCPRVPKTFAPAGHVAQRKSSIERGWGYVWGYESFNATELALQNSLFERLYNSSFAPISFKQKAQSSRLGFLLFRFSVSATGDSFMQAEPRSFNDRPARSRRRNYRAATVAFHHRAGRHDRRGIAFRIPPIEGYSMKRYVKAEHITVTVATAAAKAP